MKSFILVVLGFSFVLFVMLLINNDSEEISKKCDQLDNKKQIEYCRLSYKKGL